LKTIFKKIPMDPVPWLLSEPLALFIYKCSSHVNSSRIYLWLRFTWVKISFVVYKLFFEVAHWIVIFRTGFAETTFAVPSSNTIWRMLQSIHAFNS
jgi:hypothetical protein